MNIGRLPLVRQTLERRSVLHTTAIHLRQSVRTRVLSRSLATSPAPAIPKRLFGQPTFETHPHLLNSGEVTPGCSAIEYAVRRAKLAAELPEGGVAIIVSASIQYRSGPVFHEFHQDPDLFYLTGFLEPEAVCVIEKTGPDGQHKFHMFVRGKDEHAELWDGARSGVQAAQDLFNADEAYDVDTLPHQIPPLLEKAQTVFCNIPSKQAHPDSAFMDFTSRGQQSSTLLKMLDGKRIRPLRPIMHRLRSFKSEAEIAIMRMAGKISGRAFNEAMGQHFTEEKDLWAFLEYAFKVGGCEKSAYVPVVAGGENALSIHYTRNNDVLRDGDLVLVDAGGQYGGYVTDITRTWPVNGKFTAAQRDLYEAVLIVQRHCVSLCRENAGNSLDEIHRIAADGLATELRKLGFTFGGEALNSILFPHHVGHYVGIDLHDCASYGRLSHLRAGQVVTIEPGVYVPDDSRWPKHFRGMGIRIEDSVCVGKEHPTILSVEAAKEVVDIEALRDK